MKRIFFYLKNYRKLLFLALGLATINQAFSLVNPQIARLILDRYALRLDEFAQKEFLTGIAVLLAIGIGAALISRIAKVMQDYYTGVITQRTGTALYDHGIRHAFSVPFRMFEDERSGELLFKLQKARTDIQNFITSSINIVFLSSVTIVLSLAYAFYVHWLAGLLYTLLLPILGLTGYVASKRIKNAQKDVVKELGELGGSTTETLRNVEMVKSLGLENQEIKRLNDVNAKMLDLELVKIKLIRTVTFTQGTIINAMRALLEFTLLYLVFTGNITLGEYFTLLFYSFFVFSPLYELGTVATHFQEARASMENVEKLLSAEPEVQPINPVALDKIEKIHFDNVSFHYEQTERMSLSGITCEIPASKTIAFVGPSGSGKTTLLKLLLGLYKPTSGNIFINGESSDNINYQDVRQRVGYVSQDSQLFAGTLRENLLFAQPTASEEDCIQALASASGASILAKADRGLDTKIGEGGIKLSGGERQRLAIARALLRNPDLIIFDEATSSLDSLTEQVVTETIQKIKYERPHVTTILVAHRLSTVRHADIIYVLEKGSIIESGTHETLVHQNGLYYALWRSQSAEL